MLHFSKVVLCAIFFFAALGVASSQAAHLKGRQSATAQQAVEQAMRDYAVSLRKGTPDAVASHYAKDGELLLPGMAPLKGRDAIRDFLAPLVQAVEVESVDTATDLLEVHEKTATQWGTYKQVAGERGKPGQLHEGRYSALWHLEADGQWRLVRMMMQPL
jgi:uncharacterized protein (TIGR02246 family)